MRTGEGPEELGTSALFNDEKKLMAELTEMSVESAPRRFALCEVWADDEDAGVVGWGMAFDDEAMLYLPEARVVGKRSSAQRALRLCARTGDLRLVWIDDRDERG
jgi:hypothetical protein